MYNYTVCQSRVSHLGHNSNWYISKPLFQPVFIVFLKYALPVFTALQRAELTDNTKL